jgi:hypothetical protein
MLSRRIAIVAAACWHLCLTALILPAHALMHAFDTETATANTTQLYSSHPEATGQHHPDDCQLCKLNNQLQTVSLGIPGGPVDSAITCLALGDPAYPSKQTSGHFSGRAPPLVESSTFTLV